MREQQSRGLWNSVNQIVGTDVYAFSFRRGPTAFTQFLGSPQPQRGLDGCVFLSESIQQCDKLILHGTQGKHYKNTLLSKSSLPDRLKFTNTSRGR